VHLTLRARVPGTNAVAFAALANQAKVGCPVSKLLTATITLEATLEA
jgi:lipoyl-dependent peroxiredoxin